MTAVSPVLPPSETPEALSTNVVTVDVPKIAPTVVPIASANRASLQFWIDPSSAIRPDLPAHPMSVPTVSNISMKSCTEDVDDRKQDFVCDINAESIHEYAGVVMDNVILCYEIDGISKDYIEQDKIPGKLPVVASLTETLTLEDRSPACSVEHVDSEHAKEEIVDGHNEQPKRVRDDRTHKAETGIDDIKRHRRQSKHYRLALVIGHIFPETLCLGLFLGLRRTGINKLTLFYGLCFQFIDVIVLFSHNS